jgi:hypothetical protein
MGTGMHEVEHSFAKGPTCQCRQGAGGVGWGSGIGATTQGCHNGRFWVKFTIRTSALICVYLADATLPAEGFYHPRW